MVASSWSEWPQTSFSGRIDAKTSRTVETIIHVAMAAPRGCSDLPA
jgi:hypothetical protein